MKKLCIISFSLFCLFSLRAQNNTAISIQVNAGKQIATVTPLFNGTNIEDLNHQTNGGVFSQLLHGEAFEESVDVDFMNLELLDYVRVFVFLDEMGRPNLINQGDAYNRVSWNHLSEWYDTNTRSIYSARQNRRPFRVGPLAFHSRFIPYDSIPAAWRDELDKRLHGKEQISRHWSKIAKGEVEGRYLLKRGDAYMGRQNQVICFDKGEGEWGLSNAGLNKQGIHLQAGKPYEGILRVKSERPVRIFLSLLDESDRILAEQVYDLKGDGSYEKVSILLTPSESTAKGKFAVSLKQNGSLELGYAFLQPGEWGRVKGYPLRKEFVEALQKQGIKAIRYNGSMVDVGADTYLYRWKNMIGPVDERRVCFRSGFNPYATHSFGIVEMCQVAEVIDALCMIGMSMDENYQDIRDFVEYMNGPADSQWGKLRAEHGHPEPYNLKYIEVDNERPINRAYVECMKKFALASWEVDPEMHIMASLNIGTNPQSYERGGEQYALASELFGWFVAQGKSDKMVWDPHYAGWIGFADHPEFLREMGVTLQRELAKDYPGHKLTLCPMEENGSRCDWDRGLAHAHNWNTLQRYGDCFTALGTTNTFQPHGQHYMWDQGRIHYTSNELWFQPSAYIDEKMSEDWQPSVVEAISSKDSILDVTAKLSEDKKTLSIYVVNLSDSPKEALLNVEGFKYSRKAAVWSIGDCELNTLNTVDNKLAVAPRKSGINFAKKNTKYIFPKYSYTIITLQ